MWSRLCITTATLVSEMKGNTKTREKHPNSKWLNTSEEAADEKATAVRPQKNQSVKTCNWKSQTKKITQDMRKRNRKYCNRNR
jgi:hypothetical protein